MTQAPDDRMRHREREVAARIASLVNDSEPDIADIAAELTALYRGSIPVYDLVARDNIERNTRAVLDIVVRQVRSDTSAIDTATLTQLVRRWSDQQIPLELVAHSIQVGARRLSTMIRARAAAQNLSAVAVDEIQDMMWHWATSYSAVVTAVMQENAESRAERRSTFLRRLLDGGHTAGALSISFAEHGIDAQRRYRVACADNSDRRLTSEVRATLRIRCGTTDTPVFDAVVDGWLVALLPEVPDDLDIDMLIGVGPAVLPTDAAASYSLARRAFDIGARFDRSGMVDPATLGPLSLLPVDVAIAAFLTDVHLSPVLERGDAGREIVATVTAYLHHNRRVDDTATALFLHRNTVRNRVARFTEISGLNLDVTDDLVLTWWLLQEYRSG